MDNKQEEIVTEPEKVQQEEIVTEPVVKQKEEKPVEHINKEKKNLFKKKEDLEKKKLIEDNKNLNEKVLRISAEMQNMKRRNEENLANMLKYEGEDILKKILPTIDNFERAISLDESSQIDEVKKFLNGFKMIYNSLCEILKSFEITEIECLNQPFDSNTMEAVMVEETDEVEPNTVIEVLQKGYRYKDKVIRYAMVKVSK